MSFEPSKAAESYPETGQQNLRKSCAAASWSEVFGWSSSPSTAAPSTAEPSYAPTTLKPTSEPTSPLPDATYAPTREPTEVPPTPQPTVISTYAPTEAETAPAEVATFNCTAFDGALLRIEDRDLTLLMQDGSFEVVWELPGDDDVKGVALHTESSEEDDADEDAAARLYGAFDGELCEFDAERKRCLGSLAFEPDAATIVDWTYYYGKDLGTEDGKLAFVEDVDDDEPDFSDAYDIPMAHFNGTLRSFVLLREAEDGDEDVDEDHTQLGSGDEGEYLVGVSDDGKVVVIEEVQESEVLGDKRIQVSIFMSPLNVHVQWAPMAGKVTHANYHPGKYLVAWHPKSSTENERTTLVIEGSRGPVLFRQIAGAVARRIRWYIQPEQQVELGEEVGFIKFGSRIDVFLPLDADIHVDLDQKVKGRETILATLPKG